MPRLLVLLLPLVACTPAAREAAVDAGIAPDAETDAHRYPEVDAAGECSEATKIVYVVDQGGNLYEFTPPATFTAHGYFDCPEDQATPDSMAIDRQGIAWVLNNAGGLHAYDLTASQSPLECMPSAWQTGTDGYDLFGMAFSTDTSGGDTETLFIAGGANVQSSDHARLSRVDLVAEPNTATAIATLPGSPELTGNALAELWGFFPRAGTDVAHVGRIDKQTGALDPDFMLSNLGGLGSPSAWAFAFYGGTYYIFLANDLATTKVYAMDATGTLASAAGIGTSLRIVGAGVSTCAPVVIGRTQ